MLLNAKKIVVHYGKLEAIKGASFEVDEGEIVALIGANGAGKTTILSTISGLNVPTSGEIWFKGRRIDRIAPERIISLGIAHCPEGRRIFPYMSVRDNLLIGAYSKTNIKDKLNQSLAKVYKHFPVLKERSSWMGRTLSGGEQQMLAIGRSLMAAPELLLLDEPSIGLAPLMIREVGRIIAELNREGIGILLVEQNARLALRLASRCYVLETGKVVAQGSREDLIRNEQVKKAYLGG